MLVFVALLVIHICIAEIPMATLTYESSEKSTNNESMEDYQFVPIYYSFNRNEAQEIPDPDPGTIPATPENITVTFLTPTSVRVAWQTMLDLQTHPIEKYLVTYKPTDDSYRVVQQVAGNSEAVILDRLSPSTQYSITVTAIWGGNKYRSRQVIFRTLDLPRSSAHQDLYSAAGALPMSPHGGNVQGFDGFPDDPLSAGAINLTNSTTRELPQIRGVEVGIVLIVLLVWAGAIALFFNRWGKIRMLLPYQPDYKQEQLKVPGTGVCVGATCTGQHSHQHEESDVETIVPSTTPEQASGRIWMFDEEPSLQMPSQISNSIGHFHFVQDEQASTIADRCTRSRINSAIFVSSEGKGFDSIEFLRRHGSQSVLCRKAKSAENISDEERKRRFSVNRHWGTEDSSNLSETIELTECHVVPSTAIVVASNNTADPSTAPTTTTHSAVVTTANTIVGSISIETPPPHIQKEQQEEKLKQQQSQQAVVVSPPPPQPLQRRRPQLTRQKSSSPTYQGRSPSVSPTNSGVLLNLSNPVSAAKPQLSHLPTLSISGPSPPHEEEFL